MIENIPVTFTHKGKTYKGNFSSIPGGGGGNSWDLMVNNFYWGRLRLNRFGWFFDSTPKDDLGYLLNDFVDVLIAYYQ